MNHPHDLLDVDLSINKVPNFSLIIAFYKRPGCLEQCIDTAKKYAVNKNHEFICVADHAEHFIEAYAPPLNLIKEVTDNKYLKDSKYYFNMCDKIIKENITIEKCMNEYTDIKWYSLFSFLNEKESVSGFDTRIGDKIVDGRPGRGNFYLSYNLGACLATNQYIMQMVNDDMLFTPEWDLKLWRAFSKVNHENHTCVPVVYTGFLKNEKQTTLDILNGPGAEPVYAYDDNLINGNLRYIHENEFNSFTDKVKIHNKYLIEAQHHRHYGYMGFMLMRKDLFFKFDGYNHENYPVYSQDIWFDSRLGAEGVNKIVVLDCVTLHEKIFYINENNKTLLIGG